MRRALVLRPAPGNAATCARLTARGIAAVALPLFAVRPVAWTIPAEAHDALLLTSANAVRHAGDGLARLAHLPVWAVGEATATAARAAGLRVAGTGADGIADVAARAGTTRLLHLAGRDHVALPGTTQVVVYASEALPRRSAELAAAEDAVALLHSPRAARVFAALLPVPPAHVRIAALSDAVAAAAGSGWARCLVADARSDAALVDAAAALAIDP